jgi:hypothetical protein
MKLGQCIPINELVMSGMFLETVTSSISLLRPNPSN